MRLLKAWTLIFLHLVLAQTDDSASELKKKKEGLLLLQQLISVSSRSNNTAATVNKLPPRLQAGVPLDVGGGDDNNTSSPAVQNDPGTTNSQSLDLSDPEQQSQFLLQLMTPGASGSYATSNSYTQFGKAVNYAVSLSYAPLQQQSGKRDDDDDASISSTTTTPKSIGNNVSGLRERWSPNAHGVVTDVQSYYYPYYYYNHRPVAFYPTVH